MKNRYEICDNITKIFVNSKYGNDGILTVLIDTEDFNKVNQYKTSWTVVYKNGRLDCILTKPQINKVRYCIKLHRLIMDCPENLVVDHKDGNVLNNQKSNLRIVSQAENSTNLSPNNKYCKTKYRNIYLEDDGKYAVRINRIRFGRYFTLDEAIKVRDEKIKEIYPLRRNK